MKVTYVEDGEDSWGRPILRAVDGMFGRGLAGWESHPVMGWPSTYWFRQEPDGFTPRRYRGLFPGESRVGKRWVMPQSLIVED